MNMTFKFMNYYEVINRCTCTLQFTSLYYKSCFMAAICFPLKIKGVIKILYIYSFSEQILVKSDILREKTTQFPFRNSTELLHFIKTSSVIPDLGTAINFYYSSVTSFLSNATQWGLCFQLRASDVLRHVLHRTKDEENSIHFLKGNNKVNRNIHFHSRVRSDDWEPVSSQPLHQP
jgi:hypothetical protein